MTDAPNTLAAQTILTMLAVGFVGLMLSLVIAVYSLYVAMRYFMSDDEEAAEKKRIFFITLFSNRIILCVSELLALLFFAFPYALPTVYESIYGQKVTLALIMPIDGLWIAAAGFLAVIVLSFVCAPIERGLGIDLFKKIRPAVENHEEDWEEEEDAHIELSQEQNEFIRNLLKNKEKEIDSDITEEDTDGDE